MDDDRKIIELLEEVSPFYCIEGMRAFIINFEAFKNNTPNEEKLERLNMMGEEVIDLFDGFRDYRNTVLGNSLSLCNNPEKRDYWISHIKHGADNNLLLLSYYFNKALKRNLETLALPTFLTPESVLKEHGLESCYSIADSNFSTFTIERDHSEEDLQSLRELFSSIKDNQSLEFVEQMKEESYKWKAIPREILDIVAREKARFLEYVFEQKKQITVIHGERTLGGFLSEINEKLTDVQEEAKKERKPWDDEPEIKKVLEKNPEALLVKGDILVITKQFDSKVWDDCFKAMSQRHFCNLPYIKIENKGKYARLSLSNFRATYLRTK